MDQDLHGICNELDNVLCIDIFSDIEDNIDVSVHDTIIIYNQHLNYLKDNQSHIDSLPHWKTINEQRYEFRLLIKVENNGKMINGMKKFIVDMVISFLDGGIIQGEIIIVFSIKTSIMLISVKEKYHSSVCENRKYGFQYTNL